MFVHGKPLKPSLMSVKSIWMESFSDLFYVYCLTHKQAWLQFAQSINNEKVLQNSDQRKWAFVHGKPLKPRLMFASVFEWGYFRQIVSPLSYPQTLDLAVICPERLWREKKSHKIDIRANECLSLANLLNQG
jgi:hypothetical protein